MREWTRRWGVYGVLALAGVIAALLWADLRPREPDLPAYQHSEGASADYQAGGAGCEPSALAAIRNNGEATRERKRCAEAAEEHRLKSDNLIQQTRAADAAQAQAITAYDNAKMGLWGTVGGFLTLIAAALAAYYAREAAGAARDALNYEQGRSAAELRPWVEIAVDVTKFHADEISVDIRYDIVFKNIGHTLAKHFTFHVDSDFVRIERDTIQERYARWKEPSDTSERFALMPREERRYTGSQTIMKRAIPWYGSRRKCTSFIIVASAFYWSAMDNKWHRTDRSFTIGSREDSFSSGYFIYEDERLDGAKLVEVKPSQAGETS